MPLNEASLIELIGKLGYLTDSGMCYGFPVMGIQAMLVKDLKTFKARLKFIDEQITPPQSVEKFANRIKEFEEKQIATIAQFKKELLKKLGEDTGKLGEKARLDDQAFYAWLKEKKKLNDTVANAAIEEYESKRVKFNEELSLAEPLLREIRPFLELLKFHFSPQLSPGLFDEEVTPRYQNAALSLVRGLPSQLINITHQEEKKSENDNILHNQQEEALVKKVLTFEGLYNLQELISFFKQLNPANSTVFDPPVAFLLVGGDHTISVVYDNEDQCWQLFNLSKLPLVSCKTDAEIAQKVLESFSKNGITSFVTEVFCTKEQSNDVKKWLSSQTDKEEWKNLHKIDGKESLSDSFGFSLLHNAVIAGDIDLVRALLANPNSNVNKAAYGEAWAPLHIAASRGFAEIVNALLSHAHINPHQLLKNGSTPLYLAANSGDLETVRAFLACPNVNPNSGQNNRTPLHIAVENGHEAVIKALLESHNETYALKPNQEASGKTPLHLAMTTKNVNIKVIEALLSSSLIDLTHALHLAVEIGNAEVVRALLKSNKINPNQPGPRGAIVLHLAIQKNNVEVVKALLESPKTDPNQVNVHGSTPLHVAAEKGCAEIVRALLGSTNDIFPINPNPALSNTITPLFLAAKNGHINVVNVFLSYQNLVVDSSIKMDVYDLLQYAGRNDNEDSVKAFFIAKGVSSSALDNFEPLFLDNFTPLHAAIFFGQTDVVKALIHAQCDIHQKTNGNISGLELAQAMNHNEIITILQKAVSSENKASNEQQIHSSEKIAETKDIENSQQLTAHVELNLFQDSDSSSDNVKAEKEKLLPPQPKK